MNDDATPQPDTRANGHTDSEYATVILGICGIKEEWTDMNNGHWLSSKQGTRNEIEKVVRLIKTRTVKNVRDHDRGERAVGIWKGFLQARREGR